MIIGGKHVGQVSHVGSYQIIRGPRPNVVKLKEGFSTIKDYVYVVGQAEPEITIPETPGTAAEDKEVK